MVLSSCSSLSIPLPLPPSPSFLLYPFFFSQLTESTSLWSSWPFSFILVSLWHKNSHHHDNPIWLFPSLEGWGTSNLPLTHLHPCRSVANRTCLIPQPPLCSVSYHDWGFLDFVLFSVASRTFCSWERNLCATFHSHPIPSDSKGKSAICLDV